MSSRNLLYCLFSVAAKLKGVDLDAPGNINGVPVLEVDMESFEEKPWRKPGACVCVFVFALIDKIFKSQRLPPKVSK